MTQATLTFTRNGAAAQSITIPIAPYAPGIFAMNGQGTGQAAALIAGTTAIAAPVGAFTASRPAHPGEYISLYATGLGPVNEPIRLSTGGATPPPGPYTPGVPLFPTTTQPTVTVGGVPATVQFSGLAPDLVGVYQINVQIPATAPAGAAVPVVLSMGGFQAVAVTIAIGPS